MNIVNTINLQKREDRLLSIVKQARDQKFALRVHYGVEGGIAFHNINKAFRNIVQDAKDNGYEYTIIAEDDCVFASLESFKYYIYNIPSEFDLYLGMVYQAEVNEENRIMNGYSGNTLITIHSNFYDTWLSMPTDAHCDRWCGSIAHKSKMYVCYPYVCRQMAGYSDNRREHFNGGEVYFESKNFI